MNHNHFRIALALSSLLLPALTAPLQAQDNTFTNAVDTDITNSSNWNQGTPLFGTTITSGRWNINGTTDYNQGDTTVDNGRSLVISNGAGSSGSLTISGGTLTLGGAEAALIGASGPTTQGNGTLILNGGNLTTPGELSVLSRGDAASTGTLTINSGSTFTADITSFGVLATSSGVGTINVNSGGVLQSRVIFNRTGGTNHVLNLDGGTLRANDTNDTEDWIRTSNGGLTFNVLAGGGTLDSDGHFAQRIAVPIIGSAGGDLVITGGGSIVFSGDNTFDGDTTIAAGTTLVLGAGGTTGTLGSGSLIITDDTCTLGFGHSDDLVQSTSPVTSEIATGLATGSLEQRGPGTLTLDVANTTDGTFTVSGGALRVTNAAGLGSTTGDTTVLDGGSVELAGNVTVTGETIHLTGFGANARGALQSQSGDNTWAGDINLTGDDQNRVGALDGTSLTITGTVSDTSAGGTARFIVRNEDSGVVTLAGSGNSWGGATEIFNGTFRISGADDVLSTSSALIIGVNSLNGATFDLNGRNQSVAGLRSINNGAVNGQRLTNDGSADSTLTIDNSIDFTFGGIIEDGTSNTVSIVKQGTGTETFSGINTYTGGTTVSAGCLILDQAAAIPASGVGTTVAAGAGLGFDPAGLTDGEIAAIVSNVSWDATSDLVFTVNSPNTEAVSADLSSFGGDTIVLKGDGALDLSGTTLPAGVNFETPDGGTIDTGAGSDITVESITISPGSVSGKKVTIAFTAGGNVDAYASDTLQSGSWSLVASGISSSPADVEDNVAAAARFYVLVPEGSGNPNP